MSALILADHVLIFLCTFQWNALSISQPIQDCMFLPYFQLQLCRQARDPGIKPVKMYRSKSTNHNPHKSHSQPVKVNFSCPGALANSVKKNICWVHMWNEVTLRNISIDVCKALTKQKQVRVTRIKTVATPFCLKLPYTPTTKDKSSQNTAGRQTSPL